MYMYMYIQTSARAYYYFIASYKTTIFPHACEYMKKVVQITQITLEVIKSIR